MVDWKTGRVEHCDPLQLALYRQAWADLSGVATEDVDAVFYDVRGDEVIRPSLPDRPEIERLVS